MILPSISSEKLLKCTSELSVSELVNSSAYPVFSSIMDAVYDYVVVFDKNLTLMDCSRSCIDLLKDKNSGKNFAVGKNLNVFAPDFGKRSLYKDFRIANDRKGYYEQDNFPLHNPSIYSGTSYVRFKMFQRDSIIIYAAEDITVSIQYDILQQKYLKLLAENEKLEALFLSTTSKSEPERQQLNLTNSEIAIEKILEKQNDFTEREIEIAMLIIEGKSTREMADRLYLSAKTIDFHRRNIRKKLGLTNSKRTLSSCLLNI
ncbi:LuxR C-terminal-related transcriptional regulator [Acetobacterium carbinolicum]|uniref:LuxR C-terminal-related transcriptional regulator n=1 Tax=Acetobacterium carbinolicum TaxID=52690 RepID=UPI003BF57471